MDPGRDQSRSPRRGGAGPPRAPNGPPPNVLRLLNDIVREQRVAHERISALETRLAGIERALGAVAAALAASAAAATAAAWEDA